MLIDIIRVIGVERFNQFTTKHHVTLAHTLPEHTEIESLPFDMVVETESKTREGINQDKLILRVDDTIFVTVYKLHVTRLYLSTYRNSRCLKLLVALEKAVHLVTVVRLQRTSFTGDTAQLLYL